MVMLPSSRTCPLPFSRPRPWPKRASSRSGSPLWLLASPVSIEPDSRAELKKGGSLDGYPPCLHVFFSPIYMFISPMYVCLSQPSKDMHIATHSALW